MKKILIILSLFLPLTTTQAITVDEIVAKASTLWENEKAIKVPNFSLVDIEGNVHTDESTKGKYLVINFWATWCPPCLKEIPAFVEFYEKNSDRVEILGLDYEQADKKTILEFTDTFMVNYPIILFDDKNGSQFTNFGDVFGMPTTYIYDPEGRLVDFRMGEIDIETLEKSIL
ncbi:MAG TPA: TlpA family protein disulfide reductase [Gammaproteobacteria bacterium]|jgi:thiol-disulfide isomerase/thioredoxin|nr:TlpA family protein disulfide reductase [Gammaproteobacteria bacterium]HAE04264.1 TlpA family protein disulfide reductase [Gammaproteobacteria bacterium]HAE70051.1 TlpA family protein disulfide reductase [Gammaproteobacteria bacterium]HAE73301.1 TlpA family protein disulfide reductase [Gammaproteobacteria bacterium]HAG47555.1 TlpA family protein disulfide reductase [Gammaproteobacteria bacterium]